MTFTSAPNFSGYEFDCSRSLAENGVTSLTMRVQFVDKPWYAIDIPVILTVYTLQLPVIDNLVYTLNEPKLVMLFDLAKLTPIEAVEGIALTYLLLA